MAAVDRPAGSKAALLEVVDRILRLSLHTQVACSLTSTDLEQIQHRAQEAIETLALTESYGARPCSAATPALCGLAVECVTVVERAELTTGVARLVAAGCEVLAALLVPRGERAADEPESEDAASGWTFDWVDETLEELSDQLDFLALEIYCGLGRLDSTVAAAEALPAVLEPADAEDGFGQFWGSIEHRQALEELSAWFLCVVFRAIGYGSVSARNLMEFANQDVMCLCSLLRGLLATRPSLGSLPHDAEEIRSLAFGALCGLTAPELAFPMAADGRNLQPHACVEATIAEQNRVLTFYLEVLCAAAVETGLLQVALEATVAQARTVGGAAAGARMLAFLAALVLEAEDADARVAAVGAEASYAAEPALRLRDEVCRRADLLSSITEAVWAALWSGGTADHGSITVLLKEVLSSCAILVSGIQRYRQHAQSRGPEIGVCGLEDDDAFTLTCRVMLASCLDQAGGDNHQFAPGVAISEGGFAMCAALVALAANVEDLEAHRTRLLELLGSQAPEDIARARARLSRRDRQRLSVAPIQIDAALGLVDAAASTCSAADTSNAVPYAFEEVAPPPVPPPAPVSPSVSSATAAAPSQAKGLRDVVQNAPQEFRCALDGKLLCDPVITPGGVVCERATLARWLQKHDSICPFTGHRINLEECRRCPEIRKQVTDWVRGAGRPREPKRKRKA